MRGLFRFVANLALFISLAVCAAAQSQPAGPASPPFFFIQMSDPQFGMIAKSKDVAKETELFGKAIEAANRLKPAFVVITGDLTSAAGNTTQTTAFLSIARRLDPSIPLHLVAGNHDFKGKPTPEALAAYRKTYGKDWYSFECGERLFIVLNSCLMQDSRTNPKETEAQWEWLKKTLEANRPARPVIVFQHHSWFLKDPNEPEQYFNLPLKERPRYLGLMSKHNAVAVFAGHWHRNSAGQYGSLQIVTTGPVCNPLGKPEDRCLPGFRIVKVYPDRIAHEYVGLDEAPRSIDLAIRHE